MGRAGLWLLRLLGQFAADALEFLIVRPELQGVDTGSLRKKESFLFNLACLKQ